MIDFLVNFLQQLDSPTLKNKTFLVAVSGGVDSMVLCDLLLKESIPFSVAHCNFQLRAKDSEEDEKFVNDFCKEHDLILFSKKIDLKNTKKTEKSSIQLSARNLRYEWFFRLMEQHSFDYLLTAHHLNDSLETFLINLSRGSGWEGLSGIKSSNKIIRPLLPYSKEEILKYAQKNKLLWREDSSNQETNYIRNKIRLQISPILNELHPNFLNNFSKSIQHLQNDGKIIQNHIHEIRSELFQKNGQEIHISIQELKKLNPLESYLFHLFSIYRFKTPMELKKLIDSENSAEIQSATHRLIKDRTQLLLLPIDATKNNDDDIEIYPNQIIKKPIYLKVSISETLTTETTEVLDADKISFPLRLRKIKIGDFFYPLGMNGAKKLSKFFKDEKFSKIEKENTWLLVDNQDRIVYILGKRIDNRFKITDNTQKFLNIVLCSKEY